MALIHYDPETGIFTRKTAYKQHKVGDISGTLTGDGYWSLRINGKKYRAHRIAFLYMTGNFPSEYTDHINGNKLDNRWINLRQASPTENNRNARKRKDNSSGFKGVNYYRGKWESRCRTEDGRKHLGYFDTPEEASNAYQCFSKKHFGDFHTTR